MVFGGGGFIGSHLVEGLVQNGFDVVVFDRFPSENHNLKAVEDDIEIIKGDFLNYDEVKGSLDNVDYLFHYISTTNPATAVLDPIFDITSNIAGSVMLFQAAVDSGVQKIIYPSSGGTVYGEAQAVCISEDISLMPKNPYSISKVAIEHYLRYFYQTYGMEYLILRYSNPYGERQNPLAKQGVIPIFLNKIRNNEQPVIFGDGSSVRDYIYIQDAIDATIASLKCTAGDAVFNVGSGQGVSLNQLIEIMSDVCGRVIHPVYVEDSGIYISRFVLDISRISQATGWEPKVTIRDGVEKTWSWLR